MEDNHNTHIEESKSDIQISDVIEWAISHKLFIAISVIVCVFIALFYSYRAPSIYKRESSVMLRTSVNGQAQMGELAIFEDMGMFNTGMDVYNEIEAFRSPILMEEVVERLGLNTTYQSKNWIGRTTDWYDQTPVKAEFSELTEKIEGKNVQSFSFTVTKGENKQEFFLQKFYANGDKIESEKIVAKANIPTKTPIGNVTITPTALFENFNDPIRISHAPIEIVAQNYLTKLSAELADKKATVINFSITDNSAKRAEDILNTLLKVYNEDWVEFMNQSTLNTSEFIKERLAIIEQELGTVDKDIEKFKSDNKLLDITAEMAMVTEESSKYSDQAFKMNNQLYIAKFIREYLVDNTKEYELLPSNSGIENDNVESLIGEYNKLLLDRQRLADNSSNSNPLVTDLNNQLKLMRATILKSIDNLINTLQIQVDKIAEQENKITNRISDNPGKVRELLSIERQQKIKEELYLYLLQKREENELSSSLVVDNTRLLKPASGPLAPISPKKPMILAVGLILGLAIPFGYMFLTSMMNTTVRGRKDLESLTAPIIGEIPQIGKAKRYTQIRKMLQRDKSDDNVPTLLVKEKGRDIANEAFRIVRTNLDFILNTAESAQIMLVTSYHAGSGKTFCGINLAATMALKGKRVAIVDLDIRKGTLSKFVNSPRKGVAAYLNNQATLDNITITNANGVKGLDVIPAGTLPPNPSELLLEKRLDELAAELKTKYDYIFLDCPPAGIIADASIIARVVDRTIFIIRVGVLDRRQLPEIQEIQDSKQYPNMTILLNSSRQSNFGYSRYGYSYGRYSYGNDND